MKSIIKYENLSNDIKTEIENYHELLLIDNKNQKIEDSMEKWFDKRFDLWLNTAYSKKKSSSRKHFRLEIELPLQIIETVLAAQGDDAEAISFVGSVINISRGGLYFKYHKAIEISSIIKVFLDLKRLNNDVEHIEALAMVVRADKFVDEEYGIGVMFSSIYDTDKVNLDLLLLKSLSHYMYSVKN